MSDLREEITDILEIYGQGYSKRSFEQAVDKILSLPSLQETIEKAEKYDKLFENIKEWHKVLISDKRKSLSVKSTIAKMNVLLDETGAKVVRG